MGPLEVALVLCRCDARPRRCAATLFSRRARGKKFAEGKLDQYEIATASAESELHAAAESLRLGLHIQHIAQELGLPVQETIMMKVDSTAAIGKIQGPRGSGKMKHIDLRDAWIQRLRCKKIVDVVKVAGTENGADFFTKLVSRADFCKEENKLMAKFD